MRVLPVAVLAFLAAPSPADPPAATAAAPPVEWRTDPVCRTVFHAVLEGLHEGGVQDGVVNAVVPRDPTGDPVKA